MTVLPIVERELRVASRRWGTYILRLTAATAAIALATIIYLASTRDVPASIGRTMFGVLGVFAFIWALLIGVRVTSDSISNEKREGTLGLLFLTDLKAFDIVLGKLFAFGLDAFYALIAILPVLAVPILLGAVTPDEILRLSICVLVTGFFSLCMGMFVSSFSVVERKASIGTFLVIAFLTAGQPVILAILASYSQVDDSTVETLWALSPAAAIVGALNWKAGAEMQTMYTVSVMVTLAYSLVALVLATMIVPRVWHDSGKDRKVSGVVATTDRQSRARRVRQSRLETGPTFWLASRGRWRGVWLWVFLGLAASCWIWGLIENGRDMLELGATMFIMFIVHGIVKLFVASEAVRIYSEEDKQGSLELLLCTPIPVKEVLRGQLISLFHYVRWPVLMLLAADLFLVIAGRQSWVSRNSGDLNGATFLFMLGLIMFILDCMALAVVGLWHGLIGRNSRSAFTSTVARILVLPWVVYGLLNLTMGLLRIYIAGNFQIWAWFGLGLLFNAVFGWQAWSQLRHNLRAIAATRFQKQPSRVWASLGRLVGRMTARTRPAS